MSRFLRILILTLGASTAAYAFQSLPPLPSHDHDPAGHQAPTAVPEIDPASAASAFTLLAGGLAVIRGRRTKRKD